MSTKSSHLQGFVKISESDPLELPPIPKDLDEDYYQMAKPKIPGVHYSTNFKWASCADSESVEILDESTPRIPSACTIDPAFQLSSKTKTKNKIAASELSNKENLKPRSQILVSRYTNLHRDSGCSASSNQSKIPKKLVKPSQPKPIPVRSKSRFSVESSDSQPIDRYGRLRHLEGWSSQNMPDRLSHNSPVRLESYSTQQMLEAEDIQTLEKLTSQISSPDFEMLQDRVSIPQQESSSSIQIRRLTVQSESVRSKDVEKGLSDAQNHRGQFNQGQAFGVQTGYQKMTVGNQTSRFDTEDIILPNLKDADVQNYRVDAAPKFASLLMTSNIEPQNDEQTHRQQTAPLSEMPAAFPAELEDSFTSAYSKLPTFSPLPAYPRDDEPRRTPAHLPNAAPPQTAQLRLLHDLSLLVRTDLANKATGLLNANKHTLTLSHKQIEEKLNSDLGSRHAVELVHNMRLSFQNRLKNYSTLSNLLFLKREPADPQNHVLHVYSAENNQRNSIKE